MTDVIKKDSSSDMALLVKLPVPNLCVGIVIEQGTGFVEVSFVELNKDQKFRVGMNAFKGQFELLAVYAQSGILATKYINEDLTEEEFREELNKLGGGLI